jgi:hypothetical protein
MALMLDSPPLSSFQELEIALVFSRFWKGGEIGHGEKTD